MSLKPGAAAEIERLRVFAQRQKAAAKMANDYHDSMYWSGYALACSKAIQAIKTERKGKMPS